MQADSDLDQVADDPSIMAQSKSQAPEQTAAENGNRPPSAKRYHLATVLLALLMLCHAAYFCSC